MQPDLNKQTESFPQENIEVLGRQIEKLKKEARFKEAQPKEIIKESLKVFNFTPAGGHNSSHTTDTTDHGEDELLPDYMKNEPKATKEEAEGLLHIAIQKGIPASIKEAMRHGPYMLDALHDALVDKLYPILKERNLF